MVGGRWQILVSVEDGSAGAGAEEGSDFEPGSRLARLKGAGENYLLRARGYGPRIRLYFPVVLSCSNLTIHGSRPSAYGLQGVVQLKSQNPVKKKKSSQLLLYSGLACDYASCNCTCELQTPACAVPLRPCVRPRSDSHDLCGLKCVFAM